MIWDSVEPVKFLTGQVEIRGGWQSSGILGRVLWQCVQQAWGVRETGERPSQASACELMRVVATVPLWAWKGRDGGRR